MGNCIAPAKHHKPKSPNPGTSKKERHLHRALSSSSDDSSCCSSSSSTSSPRKQRSSKNLVRNASFEVLPAGKDGITRLKLVISKKELDDIVSGNYSPQGLDFFDNLVTSLLKQELQARS